MSAPGVVNLAAQHAAKRRLDAVWESLCDSYLTIRPERSIWRFNRAMDAGDAEQGWKIHVSATILTATQVFERVAPVLQGAGLLFKAARSLDELQRLNCGLFYGYSQVGKFITVYPRSEAEAVDIARKLCGLVSRLPAPAVPYDLRYRASKCIYYRYGAFGSLEVTLPDGTRQPAIRSPRGELEIDRREPGAAVPKWAADPFRQPHRPRARRRPSAESPLKTKFHAFLALSQRGKGGVYQALDESVRPVRPCIVKEGRRHGETDWDGRDGYYRARHEETVLKSLRDAGVAVPQVYASFEAGPNYYLVLELIEGVSLQSLLNKGRRSLPTREALGYGLKIAELLERVHAAGWVWRDCKPLNLIVTPEGDLRPLDFEGACRVGRPERSPWGTLGYAAPESQSARARSRLPEDLYALGATLHHLLGGRVPAYAEGRRRAPPLRRDLHPSVRKLVAALLDPDSHSRPDLQAVKGALTVASLVAGSPTTPHPARPA